MGEQNRRRVWHKTPSDSVASPVWPGPLKGDPYRVLVADDDPVCLKTVEQMLKHCNYLGARHLLSFDI